MMRYSMAPLRGSIGYSDSPSYNNATLSGFKSRMDEMILENIIVNLFFNSKGVSYQFPEQRNKNQVCIFAMNLLFQ